MITNDSRGLHRQRPNDQRLRRVGAFRSSPPKIFDFSQPILKGGNPARPMHVLGRSPEPVHAAVRARVPRSWTPVGAPAPVRVQDRHAARAGRAARGERVGRAAGRAGGASARILVSSGPWRGHRAPRSAGAAAVLRPPPAILDDSAHHCGSWRRTALFEPTFPRSRRSPARKRRRGRIAAGSGAAGGVFLVGGAAV